MIIPETGSEVPPPLKVGDYVLIKGRSKHRGRRGVIVKFCAVKIGVKLPGVDAVTYYKPHSLRKEKPDASRDTAEEESDGLCESDQLVLESYLKGCEILKLLAKGKDRAESRLRIGQVLEAWKISVDAIFGSEL